jgi:nucleoside-diphosphate-sugar epimerase
VPASLGDGREVQKMLAVTRGVDIVLHGAAYKPGFFSEYNPFESVQTNAIGVQKVLQAAIANRAKIGHFYQQRHSGPPHQRHGHLQASGGTAGERRQYC